MSALTLKQQAMVDVFQKHVDAELAGDIETTMATMTANPHLHNVSNMMGGVGREGVRRFYSNHLVGKFFPPDVEMIRVSLTVGEDQIVEELVIKFTHTTMIEWMLPNHIYWDQATVLVQLGLLDPKGLPVCGGESAQKILSFNG